MHSVALKFFLRGFGQSSRAKPFLSYEKNTSDSAETSWTSRVAGVFGVFTMSNLRAFVLKMTDGDCRPRPELIRKGKTPKKKREENATKKKTAGKTHCFFVGQQSREVLILKYTQTVILQHYIAVLSQIFSTVSESLKSFGTRRFENTVTTTDGNILLSEILFFFF